MCVAYSTRFSASPFIYEKKYFLKVKPGLDMLQSKSKK